MVFKPRNYDYFEYQVIPFGLANVLAINQDYINKILAEKLDVFVIMYLDNIFVYTKNEKKVHVKAI